MNQWALITGASQGMGFEFSRLFAADNFNLVLIARDEPRLLEIAANLTARHGIQVKVLARDLSQPHVAADIFKTLQREGIHISVLVNNAGFSVQGLFADSPFSRHADLILVNMTALVELTHLFLGPMRARGTGRILNVASTASFMSGPFQSTYYASKAFVHSFSQGIASELAGTGITVTTLYPGLTRTEFHKRAGIGSHRWFKPMDAAEVARQGYRALMTGRTTMVTGWLNKVFVIAARLVPLRFLLWAVHRINRSRLHSAGQEILSKPPDSG